MMDRSTEEVDWATNILERAVEHTVERLERFPRLQHIVSARRLEANPETRFGVRVVPASDGLSGCVIQFSPGYIRQLSRDHRHPEWVLTACLERQLLSQTELWGVDELERAALVAHREKWTARVMDRKSEDAAK